MMSGTSADGIDAALLQFSATSAGEFRGHWHFPYPAELQERLFRLQESDKVRPYLEMDREIGRLHGQFAQQILASGVVFDLVALHGQTVAHQPDGPDGYTWQIGSAYAVAQATGRSVAHDFRRADVVAGGQGAPLVPPFHAAWLATCEPLLVLNLGGMANLTWVPEQGSREPVRAFDTGPGNVLIDAAVQLLSEGNKRYDANGDWATQGQIQESAVQEWLAMDYFRRTPPKSTGRELFNARWVATQWSAWRHGEADFLASLTALTAASIAQAAQRWLPTAARMLVFGGGAHNHALLTGLQAALPDLAVDIGEQTSKIPSAAMEPLAFAWLGGQCLLGRSVDLQGVTGQREGVVLGSLYPGKNWSTLLNLREQIC
ncbi:anhydro-N-acetylmuramic acid kinase [Acidithiobacillus sp. IBUN Pt1247-S3]